LNCIPNRTITRYPKGRERNYAEKLAQFNSTEKG
jgi:hypothetical protein